MTQYAVDADRNALVRITTAPNGSAAHDVASIDHLASDSQAALAQGLTMLSDVLWRTYTDPASTHADELLESDSEIHHEGKGAAAEAILDALSSPNLLDRGQVLSSYIAEIEAAHQVGRVLHEIDDGTLRNLIRSEVEAEIGAIEQAELGYFAGRASQAVLLTRADASPPQVAAAFDFLEADPFGTMQLSEQIDPHSASVAAAYWLLCAAEVASDISGVEADDVVVEADNIEAVPVEVPTLVLGLLSDGEDPYDVIGSLIGTATEVGNGVVSSATLVSELNDLVGEADQSIRLSAVDPRRPALDLLEDLLLGIRAAFLLWDEYADGESLPDEDAPPEEWESFSAQKRESFANEVRRVAEANRHLIGLVAK